MPGVHLASLLVHILQIGGAAAVDVQSWWLDTLWGMRASAETTRHVLMAATATAEMWARCPTEEKKPSPHPFDFVEVCALTLVCLAGFGLRPTGVLCMWNVTALSSAAYSICWQDMSAMRGWYACG